jgi:hypothetical protein
MIAQIVTKWAVYTVWTRWTKKLFTSQTGEGRAGRDGKSCFFLEVPFHLFILPLALESDSADKGGTTVFHCIQPPPRIISGTYQLYDPGEITLVPNTQQETARLLTLQDKIQD